MKLGKQLRAAKDGSGQVKSALEQQMAQYADLLSRADAARAADGGGEDEGELDSALQQLLPGIEAERGRLQRARERVSKLKADVREVDGELAAARAQIAAQTALLEEDQAM